jgi:hypothetical protein
MSDIEKLLEEARQRATNYGAMYGAKETADDFLKTTYALIREDAPQGSVADMDAWVRRQPEYRAAIERKCDAYQKWKTAETYLKLLFAQVDVYRTEQANNRYLDKGHQ